jgi:hypothetical protein
LVLCLVARAVHRWLIARHINSFARRSPHVHIVQCILDLNSFMCIGNQSLQCLCVRDVTVAQVLKPG